MTAAAGRKASAAAPPAPIRQQPDPAGDWALALLDPLLPCPPGLRVWNASDPTLRLAVYRNNVLASLVDALAASFPVLQALVGEAFFRAMAAVFVRAAPPRSAVLVQYGDGLADFIAGFAPASGLPYLPDIARLEQARIQAFHAADAAVLTPADAASALRYADRTGELRLVCHPALQLVRSAHPVVALWAAHQDDAAIARGDINLGDIDLSRAESALVLRPALAVHVVALAPGAAAFTRALRRQANLAAAAADATQADPGFDLAATLTLLLVQGALTAVQHPENSLKG